MLFSLNRSAPLSVMDRFSFMDDFWQDAENSRKAVISKGPKILVLKMEFEEAFTIRARVIAMGSCGHRQKFVFGCRALL